MDELAAQAAARSDAELITAAASGDTAAYDVLRERHAPAARSLAGLLSADPAEADEITAAAFTRLHNALHDGNGPEVALRPRLFMTVRRAACQRLSAEQPGTAGEQADPVLAGTAGEEADPVLAGTGRDADPTQDSQEPLFVAPNVAELVSSPLNRAFLSRPQRSRAVLWHLDVEQIGPAETAAILGLTQEGVFEFAAEARAGLRQSYLSQYVAGTSREDCASAMAALGAGADGQLSGLGEPFVARHLHACPDCRAAVVDLSDLAESLRRVIAPVYLGTVAAAYLQASLGGLHWTRERPRTTRPEPRSRRVLAAACGLLAAGAATGLALTLTATAAPREHPAAQNRAAAAASPSSPPASAATVPPGSPSAGPAPSPGPASEAAPATPATSPPASPSPFPVPTLSGLPSPPPSFSPPGPTPSPTPSHRRRHHPPFS